MFIRSVLYNPFLLAVFVAACTPAERQVGAAVAQAACLVITRTLEPGAESLCATLPEIIEAASAVGAAHKHGRVDPTTQRAAVFDEIKRRRAP